MTRRVPRPYFLVLLVAAALLAAVFLIRPGVPREVTLLTGPEGSTEHEYGLRYADYLRDAGVRTNVVATSGTLENLRRTLEAGDATIAFLPAGAENVLEIPEEELDLVSLGSIYLEPLWLFMRPEAAVTSIEQLDGLRVVTGQPGTDSWGILTLMVRAASLTGRIEPVPAASLDIDTLRAAFLDGRIDGLFIAGTPETPLIGTLLHSPLVVAVALRRTEAIVLRAPSLERVRIPAGAVDLARDIPPEDLELVAANVNLVAREDVSPAVVDLLMDAARRIHRERSLLSSAGAFPRPAGVTLPLEGRAERNYTEGPSPLRLVFPFWLATLLDRFLVLIVTALTAAFALLNVLPKLLKLPFTLASIRAYGRLEAVEKRAAEPGVDRDDLLADLHAIDESTAGMRVPAGDRTAYLELRQYLHDMRERIRGGAV